MGATVTGRDALRARFAKLAPGIRESVQKALVTSGEELAATARALAPQRTGALRASIKAAPIEDGDAFGVEVTAGDAVAWYARIVESKIPYFNPAIRASQKRALSRISRAGSAAAKRSVQR